MLPGKQAKAWGVSLRFSPRAKTLLNIRKIGSRSQIQLPKGLPCLAHVCVTVNEARKDEGPLHVHFLGVSRDSPRGPQVAYVGDSLAYNDHGFGP